jgi:hypothetical protein
MCRSTAEMWDNVCFWHKADIATVLNDAAFGGKADISGRQFDVCF